MIFKNIKKDDYKIIMLNTGWTEAETKSNLISFKDFGMGRRRYVLNEGWKYSEKELRSLNKKIEDMLVTRRYQLNTIKAETKLTKENIVSKLIKASNVGIDDEMFFDERLYLIKDKFYSSFINDYSNTKNIDELRKKYKIKK